MVFCCGTVDDLSTEETSLVDAKHGQFKLPNGNALIAGNPPASPEHKGEDLVSGTVECSNKYNVNILYLISCSLFRRCG